MPLYAYECDACKGAFESRHSIKERLDECVACGVSQKLRRIPSVPTILKKAERTKEKTGELVKKFIEESREELKSEKEKNKNKEYE